MSELENAKERINRRIDELPAKAIETAIKKLLKNLTIWNYDGAWGQAYGAFYSPHIKVLSKLLTTELKYHGSWAQMMDTVHAVDDYTREMKQLRLQIPEPYDAKNIFISELVVIADRWLQGNLRVFGMAYTKVKELNEFLGKNKAYNLFDQIFGHDTNCTARNDVCYAVSRFCDESDKLVLIRNQWARKVGKTQLLFNFRRKMEGQCPDTLF